MLYFITNVIYNYRGKMSKNKSYNHSSSLNIKVVKNIKYFKHNSITLNDNPFCGREIVELLSHIGRIKICEEKDGTDICLSQYSTTPIKTNMNNSINFA